MLKLASLALAFLLAAVALPARVVGAAPLVSADWLREHIGHADLTIIDLRSAAAFESAHIPGSVHSEYPGRWHAERDGVPGLLPEVPELVSYLSSLGVEDGKPVVLVSSGSDATDLGVATWPYWVLSYLGHTNVGILDGGWSAWERLPGRSVSKEYTTPRAGTFSATVVPGLRVSTADVEKGLGTSTIIIDARPPEQFLGKTKSAVAVRAGRIPGAINLPYASLFDDSAHRLKDRDRLGAEIPSVVSANSGQEIILYCNTGHWSSIDWFVLHELLRYPNARLYEGSMAAWSRDPALPVESGPPSDAVSTGK